MLSTAILSPTSPPPLKFSVKTPTSPSDHRRSQFRPASIRNSATAYRERSNDVCFAPSQMASSTSSLYDILGISIGATSQDIKSAYRKLARTCHPDVAAIDSKDSADNFIRIHAAYTTLSDPEKRAVYDRKLVFRRMRPLTTARSPGYGGRNWETDQCW